MDVSGSTPLTKQGSVRVLNGRMGGWAGLQSTGHRWWEWGQREELLRQQGRGGLNEGDCAPRGH